ncbi:SAM-dependent methyltransferase [Maritimibacter sp. 55A14]|uniref:SAM-dependent methyltransferase n=1 Tax=Maritimibacter sp. 55A14 TaxID=2174844 RepID=UPI000D609F82|nr:cyclopropane-fatty-acyl-phospholipid synthase family protein [Maritimibacter sp. 55A14]PWE33342.1 SAM-dependent methyltransferase [Maritimibacter sp. 55A14]
MWTSLLDRFLSALIRQGSLAVTYPDGSRREYGDGTGHPVAVRLHDTDIVRRLLLNPDLAAGEGYTDGTLTIEGDDLYGFLSLAKTMTGGGPSPRLRRAVKKLRKLKRRVSQYNPAARAQANVAHHYDLSGELYDLFLDADKQYSCAYFRDPDDSLEQAQADKKAHIARKLQLEPGQSVLDIGCGWGGMGLTLARDFGARVTGVTLSTEQHGVANARAREAGLEDRAAFRIQDYRAVTGRFDRIVSVGMFEHVGVPHYAEYFGKIRELLTEDGVALIHTIGRYGPPGATNPWIRKYIFPGGYVPAMSEAVTEIEKAGLMITDVEVLRLHYAETLRHWHARFTENIDRAREIYDDRFCRMWRFYLVASEMGFREGKTQVFQFQLARRGEAVPLTRDYLYPAAAPA